MTFNEPRISVVGGKHVHVQVGDEISKDGIDDVHRLYYALARMEGVSEVVPAYCSVAFTFRPELTSLRSIETEIADAWKKRDTLESLSKEVKVPVCYGGVFGQDLEWVADRAGINKDEVVRLHSNKTYTCAMLGFSPGFVYLDEVDPKIRVPRLDVPRTKVPSGSVGIADSQTGIYGVESPGGWRIIGRTPITMFDANLSPPCPVRPGDRVKFEPVTVSEFDFIKPKKTKERKPLRGVPALEVEQPGLFATIQGQPRSDFRHFGVPRSGGLDVLSQYQANYMVGNPTTAAVLEILGGHFKAKALVDLIACVTGADAPLTVRGKIVSQYAPLIVHEGDELTIGRPVRGFINYLAIAGGLDGESALGSTSTYVRAGFGGLEGRAVRLGDRLMVEAIPEQVESPVVPVTERTKMDDRNIRATRGPFPAASYESEGVFGVQFEITESSDRMGYRLKRSDLDGPRIKGGGTLTFPTYPGYVQVPPEGFPIVLQQDCQTTGGYVVTAVVLSEDMGTFSQLGPGGLCIFNEVDVDSAVEEEKKFQAKLAKYSLGTARDQVR